MTFVLSLVASCDALCEHQLLCSTLGHRPTKGPWEACVQEPGARCPPDPFSKGSWVQCSSDRYQTTEVRRSPRDDLFALFHRCFRWKLHHPPECREFNEQVGVLMVHILALLCTQIR